MSVIASGAFGALRSSDADRDCGVAAGLLGVVDQRWRIDCGRRVFEPVGGLLVGER